MTLRGPLAGVFILAILLGTGPVRAAEQAAALGDKVANSNQLRDLRGNRRALHDFKGHKAIVLVFVGADCPISNLYLPGLIDLEKKYRAKDVQFLGVYPNEQEDFDQVAAHAFDRDLPFPVLKDFGQKLADHVGVTRVPTVAVLDGDFALRYRGRIDDRYGVNARRDKATRDDLAQALEELVAGKKVSVAETEADGCLLDRGGKKTAKTGMTYTKDVARILQRRCQGCHRPDEAAPFSLLTYDDAAKHGRMLREVSTQRRMPPWGADGRYGHFNNDRRLTADEIDTLTAWVDAGMPRGDENDMPKPVNWPKGWAHGQPDQIFSMPEDFEVPADGVLPYQRYIVNTGFTEDRWIRVAECRPGMRGVVHHIVVYILKPGQPEPQAIDGTLSVLAEWAPGDLGLVCPPDTALRVPKGAQLVFEMHYTPNGTVTKDRSSVGVIFAKEPPKYELFTNIFANDSIQMQPNDPHYRAEATWRLRADARILSFLPHMHWRGQDYFYEVIYPDGKRQTLLSVPRWDFNWQNVYQLQEPLKLPKGARLHAVAHWDNSRNNPLNPDPTKSVRWGLQTWDEMMVGWVAYVWERPGTAEELAKNPQSQADMLFERLDRNGDDVITPDELGERMRPLLMAVNGKVPEKMTREEFAKIYEELRKRFPRKPGGRFGGGADKPADGAKKPEPQAESPKPAAPEKSTPTVKIGGNFEVEAIKDIAYYEGDGADQNKHKLDLFVPKGQKDFPVLLFIHGGGWTSGDRKMYGRLGETFAKNGVGTVIISYRLTPQVQHPGHIEDVARAFAWTHANISKHGGRADQIFVTGHSAGGHLAALLATNETYLKPHKLSLREIKGAMPLSGVYSITPGRLEKVFGKDEEVCVSASPIKHVSGKEPPFLIVYADGDSANCASQSEKLCETLTSKKVEASVLKVKDRTHVTIMMRLAMNEADTATQALLEFIAKHSDLKLKVREEKKTE
jgi:acetyl esterase/lipase/peroxiredoxin